MTATMRPKRFSWRVVVQFRCAPTEHLWEYNGNKSDWALVEHLNHLFITVTWARWTPINLNPPQL